MTHSHAVRTTAGRKRAVAVLAGVLVAAATLLAPGAGHAADATTLYFVQGLPGKKVDVSLDGRSVAAGVVGAQVRGPFRVGAGRHTMTVRAPGEKAMSRTMTLRTGTSTDAVLHLPAEANGDPVLTAYANDVGAVAAGKGTLQVAHTAAVPPADVLVDGKVLFENIANGEALTLTVPAGSYSVEIVPTGRKGPVVFGPADLSVRSGSLNAVYAFGDPATKSMKVAVHTVAVPRSGSKRPSEVDTGTGGQAAGFRPTPWSQLLTGR